MQDVKLTNNMNRLINTIKSFLVKGYQRDKLIYPPRNFFQYFHRFPYNYLCTFGMILFIFLFYQGGKKYESPLLYLCISFPAIILIYNFVSEYFSYKKWGHGKLLLNIAFFSCLSMFLLITILLFVY